MLEFVRNMIPKNINCIYIRQADALGLGHAVLCAKPVIGDEPFAVLLADDLLVGMPAVMKQMTDTYDYYRCSVLGVQDVPRADTKSYGIVDARKVAERVEQVNAIVEKPKPEDAPSTLAVVGRYILTPAHLPSSGEHQAGCRRRGFNKPTASPRYSAKSRCWPTGNNRDDQALLERRTDRGLDHDPSISLRLRSLFRWKTPSTTSFSPPFNLPRIVKFAMSIPPEGHGLSWYQWGLPSAPTNISQGIVIESSSVRRSSNLVAVNA